ncbi:MAG: SDR family oxidoreductase [Myxococcota bacterium]|nr:SDR family oxidoreductase [Myxococcota bacterium]
MSKTPPSRLALVTGASTGIGRSFAETLARQGSDLILVARDTDRLEALARRLAEEHGRQSEVLTADLTRESDLAAVEERLRKDGAIDLLVNNAGFGVNGNFADVDIERSVAQVDLNVTALVRLAHAALSTMRPARRGRILNVSSGLSFIPSPRSAVYGATKAFVTSFSQALHVEVSGEGVVVTAVCPGLTRTEFQERGGYATDGMPDFAWQSAQEVVDEALAASARGEDLRITGFGNRAMLGVVKLLPSSRVAALASRFLPED